MVSLCRAERKQGGSEQESEGISEVKDSGALMARGDEQQKKRASDPS